MKKIGYSRSSNLVGNDIQITALKKAGCNKIFLEKNDGPSMDAREELQHCLEYLKEGDTLVITKIDRLARSIRDLQDIVDQLISKKVALEATEQPIKTSTSAGKTFFKLMSVFSEFEINLRRERQLEGIARAKSEGKYQGRKKTARAKSKDVIKLSEKGLTRKAIAEQLGIGVASVYRILADEKKKQ